MNPHRADNSRAPPRSRKAALNTPPTFRHPFLPPNRIPVLEEDAGQAAHRLSRETYAGVEPVAVGMGDVKVLLRQIVAAGKAHLAVDDRYFSGGPGDPERR